MTQEAANGRLRRAVERVVRDDLCSGCGACTLVSPHIAMDLSVDGYLRPIVHAGADDVSATRAFQAVCPGVRSAPLPPASAPRRHPIFGRYHEAWVGWATDSEIRFDGSSGGALTALAGWVAQRSGSRGVTVVKPQQDDLIRPVPVVIHSSREALASAGSRYAPVAALQQLSPEVEGVVVKPCEAVALRAAQEAGLRAGSESPLILTFFCAGTPSAHATRRAVTDLGVDPDALVELRYRGHGWPGDFTAVDSQGNSGAMTYERSWGEILGRQVQWRCKLCPDGCGESGDIAVGDYWDTDHRGFPRFADADGRSVIIARTVRGLNTVREAAAAGVIHIEAVGLNGVASIQPLQVERRRTLAGRMVGALLAGRRIPRYRGYGLVRLLFGNLVRSTRYAVGTARRARRPGP